MLAERSELNLDDAGELLLADTLEDDDIVNPVQELGLEVGPQGFTNILFGHRDTDVRRHDQNRVLEIDGSSLTVGQAAIIKDLEHDVPDVRMGLLNFVEQNDRIRPPPYALGKVSAFFIADISRRRSNQTGHRMFLHVFGHINANHRPFIVEKEFGQSARGFGLSDTGRSQEHEDTNRPITILEPGARAAYGIRHGLQSGILTYNSLGEQFFHPDEFLDFAFKHLGNRNAGPLRDDFGNVLLIDLLLEHALVLLQLLETRIRILELPIELLKASVTDFGHTRVVALTFGLLLLDVRLLDLFFDRTNRLNQFFLALPAQLHPGGLLAELTQFLLNQGQTLTRAGIVFLTQRLALDFKLDDLPFHGINLHGHRVDFNAQTGGRLIDEVNGFVGQETVRDVTVGQHGGREDRGVLDLHAMVNLIPLLQAAQDRDRIFNGRLTDVGFLEAAFQRFVLLDIFLILAQSGRANAAQVTARQRRLQHIGGIDGALGPSGSNKRVKLVDKKNNFAAGF